jgi:alanyl-tRNA synthetase
MQYDQRADGSRVPLPKPCIDTGAGLERNLMVVQGKTAIWDIDVFRPLIARAERATGAPYGDAARTDVSLRIIAEHARAVTFMIADGVRPSNNERGYVLRRIIRRAVLHAYMLGARDLVLPAMVLVSMVALCYTLFLYCVGATVVLQLRRDQAEFVGISLLLLTFVSMMAGALVASMGLI